MLRALVISLCLVVGSGAAHADAKSDATALLKSAADLFNKGDAKALAAMFADDADVYNPAGQYGKGRAAIEKLIAGDMAGLLKGATNSFTLDNAREIGGTLVVDATHEAKGMTGPDGKKMDGKVHVVFVLVKAKDGKSWQIAIARPYMFLPPPAKPATPPTKK